MVILDQASKLWIKLNFTLGQCKSILGDLLIFTYWENPGAAFGLLPGATHLFVLISVLSVAGSVFIYYKYRPYGLLGGIALGLISGGAFGNLIDRAVKGKVTDFISFKYFAPVFNVADSAIVVGAFLLGFLILFFKGDRQKPS